MTSELQKTYSDALTEIRTLESNLASKSAQYDARVQPGNSYFNQDIKFSNNIFAHVTNKGVVKKYPDSPPTGINFVSLDLPWLPAYETPNVQIPTSPPLITGTPVGSWYSGFEGENVYVNTIIPDASSTYKGCKVTNDSIKFIGGGPMSSLANGTYTYDACKQAAINDGYKYYGIQNINAAGTGFCAVTNDAKYLNASESITDERRPIYTIGGGGAVGNILKLTDAGQLISVNMNSELVSTYVKTWDVPPAKTTTQLAVYPSEFVGCYGLPTPATNKGQMVSSRTPSSCYTIAKNGGYPYYGMRNGVKDKSGKILTADMVLINKSELKNYTPLDQSKCYYDGTYYIGNKDSTAIYTGRKNIPNVTVTEVRSYFLLVQNDGIRIYRGTPTNSKVMGPGWVFNSTNNENSKTTFIPQNTPLLPNPKFAAAKSKYGKNYLVAGQTLAAGEFIGSPDGSLYLLMDSNGVLSLNTSASVPNCKKQPSGMYGGGVGANAIYELVSGPGFRGEIGKLGYVDENSGMHLYANDETDFSNTYAQFDGLNSSVADISSLSSVSDPNVCQTECNNNAKCGAVVYNTSTKNCNLKGSDFTSAATTTDPTTSLYIRNKQPTTLPYGISSNVNNIDSIKFRNYNNGGVYGNPKVNATSVERSALDNADTRAKLLYNQLAGVKEQFDNMTDNINGINTTNSSINSNHASINSNAASYKLTREQAEVFKQNVKQGDNIVKDSNIVVLQRNYNYMLWSILATGAVLVSMAVVRK